MKRGLLAIIAISLFASCADDRSASVADIVSQWEGREILFPENSVFTIQGRDTVDFQFQNAPYKILTYVDSVGCMSCKLQLEGWNELIGDLESSVSEEVPVVLYFNTPKYREVMALTRSSRYVQPICIDIPDSLNLLNHFTSQSSYQTFLLDKDNKVIAIGNPVNNQKIKELFLQLITGNTDVKKSPISSDVFVDATEIDFGTFVMSEKQERIFTLSNKGDVPLVVNEVNTSCGCIEVEYSDVPILPGDEMRMKVAYAADKKGYFRKTISVYCSAEESPIRVTIYGIVR